MSRLPHDIESDAARRERVFRALLPFAHDPSDPVERWKQTALRRAVDSEGAVVEPRAELGFSIGFALLALLSGLPLGRGGPLLTLLGMTAVVLADELPRALLLRHWGRSSSIVLGSSGAVTATFGRKLARRRSLASALSGPVTNLVLGAVMLLVSRHLAAPTEAYVRTLALWHGAWGAAQLLPLVPFRLGNALVMRVRTQYRAVLTTFSVKLLLLGGLVLAKVYPLVFPLGMLAVAGAVREFTSLYQASSDEKNGLVTQACLAEMLLEAGERTRALGVARRALGRARSRALRARLWRALAWAAIGEGDPLLSHGALGALPPEELDVHLVASYLATCNRVEEAVGLLERARSLGLRSPETTKLLLGLLLRHGELERGRSIAREDAVLLTSEEMKLVECSPFGSLGPA